MCGFAGDTTDSVRTSQMWLMQIYYAAPCCTVLHDVGTFGVMNVYPLAGDAFPTSAPYSVQISYLLFVPLYTDFRCRDTEEIWRSSQRRFPCTGNRSGSSCKYRDHIKYMLPEHTPSQRIKGRWCLHVPCCYLFSSTVTKHSSGADYLCISLTSDSLNTGNLRPIWPVSKSVLFRSMALNIKRKTFWSISTSVSFAFPYGCLRTFLKSAD